MHEKSCTWIVFGWLYFYLQVQLKFQFSSSFSSWTVKNVRLHCKQWIFDICWWGVQSISIVSAVFKNLQPTKDTVVSAYILRRLYRVSLWDGRKWPPLSILTVVQPRSFVSSLPHSNSCANGRHSSASRQFPCCQSRRCYKQTQARFFEFSACVRDMLSFFWIRRPASSCEMPWLC